MRQSDDVKQKIQAAHAAAELAGKLLSRRDPDARAGITKLWKLCPNGWPHQQRWSVSRKGTVYSGSEPFKMKWDGASGDLASVLRLCVMRVGGEAAWARFRILDNAADEAEAGFRNASIAYSNQDKPVDVRIVDEFGFPV